MRNLPAMDPHHWRDAPWRDSRDRTQVDLAKCVGCSAKFKNFETRQIRVSLTEYVNEYICPECGWVDFARRHDTTESYLKAWRGIPEEMEETIDNYSELKEIHE